MLQRLGVSARVRGRLLHVHGAVLLHTERERERGEEVSSEVECTLALSSATHSGPNSNSYSAHSRVHSEGSTASSRAGCDNALLSQRHRLRSQWQQLHSGPLPPFLLMSVASHQFQSADEQKAFLSGVAVSSISPLAQQLVQDTFALFNQTFGATEARYTHQAHNTGSSEGTAIMTFLFCWRGHRGEARASHWCLTVPVSVCAVWRAAALCWWLWLPVA